MTMPRRRSSRREFLKSASAAAGLCAFWPSGLERVLAADPKFANEKIRIGHIGVGNQGRGNLGKHLANTVAVCDVDKTRLGEAKERVEKATKMPCAAYGDFRKLLDDKNVDAVVITTPDHWHAIMTIAACAAGKDVYCEKPLSLYVVEGRAMVEAARKFNRIVQTGSQQRSAQEFRTACEMVRNGRIGKIKTIKVGLPGVNFKGPSVPDGNPPAELDYDLWLGPAAQRPYNEKRVHYNFRFFRDYSGGQLTNWGAHHLDIAQWGLGMDASGPVAIEGKARYHKDNWFEVPEWFNLTYTYASGVVMYCGQDYKGGTTFEGEKGTIWVNRGKSEYSTPEILKAGLSDKDERLIVSRDQHANWLECVRSRKMPICDVEIGHRSATVCHLGNIALLTGRKLRWDPVKEQVIGDTEAAKLCEKAYREPWKLVRHGMH
jgi:predicted dehydrogenase